MDTVDCSHWCVLLSGKSIASQSFTLHEAHCKRNYYRCSCGSFLKLSTKAVHEAEQHQEKACPNCSFRAFAYLFDPHDCPNKPRECPFCEAQILASEFLTHERECGTRTEQCGRCFRYVQKRGKQYAEWLGHQETCGSGVEQPVRTHQNPAGHYDSQLLRAQLLSENYSEEEVNSILGAHGTSDSPPGASRMDDAGSFAVLRAKLRSENVPEEEIAAILGADPSAESHQRAVPMVEHHSDSESDLMDSIPSIDFTQFPQNMMTPSQESHRSVTAHSVPSHSPQDLEVSNEERELNEAIMKSLSEK